MTTSHPASPGSTPAYDPELAAWLPLPSLVEVGLTAARASASMADDAALTRGGRFDVRHVEAPGAAGSPGITLLVCRPRARRAAARIPVLYHVHGGGMVTGNRTSGIERTLGWAEQIGAAVVSVEYRLAPETPHPGPVEDCLAGLEWLCAPTDPLGLHPGQVVVTGQSAGGGLAAAMLLMARDHDGPQVAGQVLLCPMLDDRNDTPSARQLTGSVWDRRDNEFAWHALLGELAGTGAVPPYAAPARARDLSGLPATFIEVGSVETFRDEAVGYASGIWRAGGDCELHVWQGGFHSFALVAPEAALSQAAEAAVLGWLRRRLAGTA